MPFQGFGAQINSQLTACSLIRNESQLHNEIKILYFIHNMLCVAVRLVYKNVELETAET